MRVPVVEVGTALAVWFVGAAIVWLLLTRGGPPDS